MFAACLLGGETAHVSHRAAAALWGIDRFGTELVEISTTRNVRADEHGVVVHRVQPWPECDTSSRGGIPVTEPGRTLIDLAAAASAEDLEVALDDALRRRLITLPRLVWRLDVVGVHGKAGVGVLTRLVDERRAEKVLPESWMERKVIQFLARCRHPAPVRQFPVFDGHRFVGRTDLAYPERRIAIEADGYEHHSDRVAWERDRARGNDLVCLGWTVVHVTWKQLTQHPEALRAIFDRLLGEPEG